MACLHQPAAKENSSVPDLDYGLPSPDESDDEHLKTCTDIGIIVPSFCNKLREQTRPLFTLSLGAHSPSKQLRETTHDRPKESRAKKRLFKGKQQPSAGVIERRYGYIPNPRWARSYTYAKPYDPVGVDDKDKEGIPGVVFRNTQTSKAVEFDHSYQDSDFPSLNSTHSDRLQISSSSIVSAHVIHTLENRDKSNSNHPVEPPQHGTSASFCVLKSQSSFIENSISPSTSTPIKRKETVSCSTASPALDSGDVSVYTSDSSDSTSSSLQSHLSPDTQGLLERRFQTFSPNSDFPPLGSPRLSKTQDGSVRSVSWSATSTSLGSAKKSSPLVSSVKATSPQINSVSHVISVTASSPCVNSVTVSSPFVNSVTSTSSHVISKPQLGKNLDKNDNCSYSWADGLPKPLASNIGNQPSENTKYDLVNALPLTDLVRPELSASCLSENNSRQQSKGWTTSSNTSSQLHLNTDKPEQPGLYRAQKLKSTKGRNQRQKHSDDSCGEDSSKNVGFFHSNNDVHHTSQNKQFGSSSRGAIKNSSVPRSLTLESFMTPQKNTRKKNESTNSRKDFESFRNRFVEQLSVSPISPPKKVRPSPVKRIDSSQMNESLQSTQFSQSAKPLKEPTGSQYQIGNNFEKHNISSNESDVIIMEKSQEENEKFKNKMSTAPVFSLEKSLEVLDLQNAKDIFEVENGNDVEVAVPVPDKEAEIFWIPKQVSKKPLITSGSNTGPPYLSCENDEDSDETSNFVFNIGRRSTREESNDELVDTSTDADPLKVTHKGVLCKYARRYCHFIEEHQVPNIAIELYFIIQLLTCTHLDVELVRLLEKKHDRAYFNSKHNGVYFAVTVIKRLKHMFVMLETAYLQLLATNLRIQRFYPSLHQFFQQASANRKLKDNHVWSPVDYTTFNPPDDGAMSFPDTNTAHVFKCQRDNFYAFYRHYHDTDSVYEFRIENQIQYVYDGCTPEQNSVVNLMHLAKLFLDHLILCCVKQAVEQVDILKMLQSKNHDEKLFLMLYEVFSKTSSNSSACPSPGFSCQQMFFRDFIETLSCPAFNEHLRSLLVFKILELNATDFSNSMDLHSVVTIADDQIAVRAERLTETVKTLCLMGKFLGYLTFLPYTSGGQNLASEQSGHLLAMREMIPLPLPLPLLLKQAFEKGHLSLTVPWVVEYLAMMDQMAPQLSTYAAVLRKLHFIHRYTWTALYKQGHHLTGLLLVSCISWLFETPAIPEGYFYSFNDAEDVVKQAGNVQPFVIDRQKLVSQLLLSWCCPYIEQGQILLTLFMLQQESSPSSESSLLPESVTSERSMLPVSPAGADLSPSAPPTSTSSAQVADIEQWLGISLAPHKKLKKETNIIDDEVVPAYVLTNLLARKEMDDIEDLEANLINNNPFLKFSVNVAVDLLCARVTDYAHKMILKLMVFEAKAEVRMQFHGISKSMERMFIKDDIVARANLEAARYSHTARESFKALCDRSLGKELPDLLLFLVSHTEDSVRQRVLCIANKLAIRRLEEWARVQLKQVFFSRVLISEADKCARTSQKYVALYPTDYSRKSEDVSSPALTPSFTEHEQLSELIDKALSYGVWYVNAMSPGVRPNDVHMTELIEDIIQCLERKLVTMDFAFAVMVNLLMHLIIQYIADAPQNWTQQSEDAFIRLCVLCKERTLEDSRLLVKRRRQLQVKVVNLLSAYSIQCLARSSNQRSLMVYSLLVFRLVTSQLLPLETLCGRLTRVREHPHLDTEVKLMVNQILVKVLQLVYEDDAAATPAGNLANLVQLLKGLWQQCVLVEPEHHRRLVWTDLADRLRTTFGSVLEL